MRTNLAAPALIVLILPLSILIGPRVGFPVVPLGDFRTQDFVVAGSLVYFLIFDLKGVFTHKIHRALKSSATVTVFWGAVLISLALIGLLAFESPAVFQFFYLARLLEPLIIGLLMYRALEALGQQAIWIFLISTGVATKLNLLWIGVQLFGQQYRPFWSFSLKPSEVHYGPGLIGDFAAFPTGQTLVVVLAGLIGFHIYSTNPSRILRIVVGVVIFATLGAVILVESRISTFVAIILAAIWAIKISWPVFGASVPATTSLVLGSSWLLMMLGSHLPRFGIENISQGLSNRFGNLYPVVLSRIEHRFVFGAGPGAIRSETGWEYHSLYLGFLSSFGIVGLSVILVAIVATVWFAQYYGLKSTNPLVNVFAFWTIGVLFNLLFAGVLQDSYIAVTPNHLAAMVIGTFTWLVREEVAETKKLSLSPTRRQ